jgi:hypothetical protein
MAVRELIVDIDEEAKQLIWSAISEQLTHYRDGKAGVLWIPDVLLDEADLSTLHPHRKTLWLQPVNRSMYTISVVKPQSPYLLIERRSRRSQGGF